MLNFKLKISIIYSAILIQFSFTIAQQQQEPCRNYIDVFLSIKDGGFNQIPSSLINVTADSRQLTKNNTCEHWLRLDGTKISKIKENVFHNLPIDGLEITNGNSILIDKRAFNGLPALRSLIVRTKPLFLLTISSNHSHNEDQEAFLPISNITNLEYPFYDDEKIKRIIPMLGNIETLKITGDIAEIKNGTFEGASPTLRRLEIATSGSMKINSATFSGLEGLTELILANVKTKYLTREAFEGLNKVENISISLDSLSIDQQVDAINTFIGLKNLKNLLIRKSPSSSTFLQVQLRLKKMAL